MFLRNRCRSCGAIIADPAGDQANGEAARAWAVQISSHYKGLAIAERLTLTSCGISEALIEGSTKAVAEVRHHSGIVPVRRYSFACP
jgi:hypothetical protein